MTPIRIQRKRTKGFNLKAESEKINGLPVVYVGRPTKFGNPFKLTPDGMIMCYSWGKKLIIWNNIPGFGIDDIVELYELWINGGMVTYKYLPTPPDISVLKGKNLSCFCSIEKPCHCDVLLKLANK